MADVSCEMTEYKDVIYTAICHLTSLISLMQETKAFLFDLNGTMIDDMDFHIKAWYTILNDLGAGISMAKVKEECYGKNDELLERVFPGRFSAEKKIKMSYAKEAAY